MIHLFTGEQILTIETADRAEEESRKEKVEGLH